MSFNTKKEFNTVESLSFTQSELKSTLVFASTNEVPRILHYMVLGDSPPPDMLEMVRVNMDRVSSLGFAVKLWRDEDVHKLVLNHGDPDLLKAWTYVLSDPNKSRLARMANFMRPLIIYTMGGVYLDADMVPCDGVDYLVDMPGVVSIPFKNQGPGDFEVNAAAMSAPPHHRLMELALEYFKGLGSEIGTLNNLDAAGPKAFAIIADRYFKELGLNLPSISEGLIYMKVCLLFLE